MFSFCYVRIKNPFKKEGIMKISSSYIVNTVCNKAFMTLMNVTGILLLCFFMVLC